MLGKITLGVFFLLLVWGNIVSGLKAGLACPDWPLCHGQVVPPFRWDIYVEFSHRVIGALAGLLLLILSVNRFKRYTGAVKAIPSIALILLLIQVTLGGLVVLLHLPVDLTTIHFSIALIILSLVIFLDYFDGDRNKPDFNTRSFNNAFLFLSILIFVQAVMGAYVRHSNAGLACPDFPKCLGYWIPPNLSGIVLIHFMHRSLAYFIFAVFLILAFTRIIDKKYKKKLHTVLGLIIVQIILGVGLIHSKLFFAVTAMHILVALFILYILVSTWYSANRKSAI